MTSTVAESYAEPFACRWILLKQRLDSVRASNWTRALCVRIPELPRPVREADCQGCAFWERGDAPLRNGDAARAKAR